MNTNVRFIKDLYGKRTFASIEELAKSLARVAGPGINKIVELFYYTGSTACRTFKVLETDDFKIEVVNKEGVFEFTLSIFSNDWKDAVLSEEEYNMHLLLRGGDRDMYPEYIKALSSPQAELISHLMDLAVYYYTAYRKEVENKKN